MENTFFTMKPRKSGFIKYILLAAIPSAVTGFFLTWDAAAWIFILLTAILILPKNYSVLVYDNSLTEKSLQGRNRFICKVNAEQIHHYHRNMLGEIRLVDSDGKKLICIESNMTTLARFEQWLADHHIESI